MLSKFFITSTRFENMGMFQISTHENDMMICGNTNERFKKKGKSRRTHPGATGTPSGGGQGCDQPLEGDD